MTGDFSAATKNSKEAKAFMAYLKTPDAAAVMRAKGLDPS